MKFRSLMLALLGLIVLAGSVQPANAQYYRHHRRYHRHYHHPYHHRGHRPLIVVR